MKIFGLELRKSKKATPQEISTINAWGGTFSLQSREYPMLLSTVYRCVDLISSSLGVLPCKVYRVDKDGFKTEALDHPAYDLLNLEPNEDMTSYTFFKTLVVSVLLTGNGYAYIERDSHLNPLQLVYIPSTKVTIVWVNDDRGIRHKRYMVAGFRELVEPADMIHILNFTYDGIQGVSTISHARQTLGIATDSEAHAKGFFKSGGSTSGILTVEGKMSVPKKQKDEIYSTWTQRLNDSPASMVILPGNMHYQPITIDPKDSQLLESRLFNVQDICRFFSVSPVKAFDLSKSSYSTIEATQLEYLTDTVLSVITNAEQEINRKIFLPMERHSFVAEFDTSTILRTDKASQAEWLTKLFSVGAITPDEIRSEMNLPRVEGGNESFVQVNTMPLKEAVKPRPDLTIPQSQTNREDSRQKPDDNM